MTQMKKLTVNLSLLFLLAALTLPPSVLKGQEAFDNSTRSLFIFDLARFIDYGEGFADSTVFRIGVLDNEAALFWAMGALAETRTHIQDKPVELVYFNSVDRLTHTQILFVNKKSGFELRRVKNALGNRQTMLITEGYGFHESMINFIVVDDEPRFDLNLDGIRNAGMNIDEGVVAMSVKSRADWEVLFEEAQEMVERQRAEIEEQQRIIAEQRAEIEAQRALLDSLDREVAEKQAELAEKQRQLETQLTQINRQGREITLQRTTIEQQQTEVAEQQEVLAAQRSEIEEQLQMLSRQIATIEAQEDRIKTQLATLEKQKLILWFVSLVLLLILLLAVIIYRGYRAKKAANIILEEKNRTISAQKDEIEKQRDIAAMQRDQIAYQKKHITDSIVYAKRIQTALLPSLELFSDELDHFVLFKPLDIVSGDFYWVHRFDDKQIIIAADCTGHGVPGAFMSMLGVTMLNEIVLAKDVIMPDQILNNLRAEIITALKQSVEDENVKDGMDMAVCLLDFTNSTLYFSGANNPLYIIRDGELLHYRPDKMPVSIHYKMGNFTLHKVDLKKGDCFYIFSDGFADQFGGPDGKKYMTKQFKETLRTIAPEPMITQGEKLSELFDEWKGDASQIDDVTVIGVRY